MVTRSLPHYWRDGWVLGRMAIAAGPAVVVIRDGRAFDLTAACSTASLYGDAADDRGADLGDAAAAFATRGWTPLSPIDLHRVKAAGVTFAVSAIERVIEEGARAVPDRRPGS